MPSSSGWQNTWKQSQVRGLPARRRRRCHRIPPLTPARLWPRCGQGRVQPLGAAAAAALQPLHPQSRTPRRAAHMCWHAPSSSTLRVHPHLHPMKPRHIAVCYTGHAAHAWRKVASILFRCTACVASQRTGRTCGSAHVAGVLPVECVPPVLCPVSVGSSAAIARSAHLRHAAGVCMACVCASAAASALLASSMRPVLSLTLYRPPEHTACVWAHIGTRTHTRTHTHTHTHDPPPPALQPAIRSSCPPPAPAGPPPSPSSTLSPRATRS